MTTLKRFSLAFLPLTLTAAIGLAACSDDNSATTTGSGGGGAGGSGSTTTTTTTGGDTTSTGTGSSEECAGPGYEGGEQSIELGSVTATVIDPAGTGLKGVQVFICGTDICLDPKTTGDEGKLSVPVPQSLKKPAFKYGDGFMHARFAIPLTTKDQVIAKAVTAVLPQSGSALEPGKAATSGDVTITPPEGSTVTVDDLTYDTPDKQFFSAVTIPASGFGEEVDPSLNLIAVYGVRPIETIFCPPAAVTVKLPDNSGLAAGTEVEFFIHGVDVGQEWAPYGGWVKVSDGKVSADGTTATTAEGGGLPVLTAFGVRKKQ